MTFVHLARRALVFRSRRASLGRPCSFGFLFSFPLPLRLMGPPRGRIPFNQRFFNLIIFPTILGSFLSYAQVMIVYCDAQDFLRFILPNNVAVQVGDECPGIQSL